MTESDIYQLVGEAYCNGMAHGMEKSASLEKKALGPDTLSRVIDSLSGTSDANRAARITGRIASRARTVLDWLRHESPNLIRPQWRNLYNKAIGASTHITKSFDDCRAWDKGVELGKGAGDAYGMSALHAIKSLLSK